MLPVLPLRRPVDQAVIAAAAVVGFSRALFPYNLRSRVRGRARARAREGGRLDSIWIPFGFRPDIPLKPFPIGVRFSQRLDLGLAWVPVEIIMDLVSAFGFLPEPDRDQACRKLRRRF